MANQLKWDRRFMELAQLVASWSKDPSTKVGAVIVRPDNTICSTGFNGFPKGMEDRRDLLTDRDEKYPRMVHAEMNAVMFAKEALLGYTMFVTAQPCERCAVHLIQAGLGRIVARRSSEALLERFDMEDARVYLNGAGVKYEFYE